MRTTKNRDEAGGSLPAFPVAGKKFCGFGDFPRQPAERAEIEIVCDWKSQEKRRTTQPIAKVQAAFLKIPTACPAGKLVDELGLKNSRVGNARVSEVHGNFIVNDGGATASGNAGIDRQDQSDGAGKTRDRIGNRSANCGRTGMTVGRFTKKIAVLMGGPGSEREVSLATGRGVSKALRSLGAEVVDIDVRDKDFELPGDVDLAFIAIHGTFGEDGQLQRILEDRGVALHGRGSKGSETAFDKIRSKEKFREHGVATPHWEVIHPGQRPTFPLPFVVKAPRQGSTVGIVIVKSEGEIESAISEAAKYGRELLIEKFVSGRELTIGILGDQALPILEIIPKGGFYDFNNKYPFLNPQAGGGAEHVCPAKIDAAKTKEIQELALRAFQAAGLQVYARVDAILPRGRSRPVPVRAASRAAPWHGLPSWTMTTWPSSTPAPCAPRKGPPARDHPASEAGTEGEHDEVVDSAARADAPFRDRRGVRVVVEPHRQAEPLGPCDRAAGSRGTAG